VADPRTAAGLGPHPAEVSRVMTKEFVEDVLGPIVVGRHRTAREVAMTVVRQRKEKGRITVRYSFDPDQVVYGKLYSKGSGSHACEVLRELWENGFGEESGYRVPEPLLYLPHDEFLLTRAVPGTPLVERVDNDDGGLARASREAARWLVRLHRHPIRAGKRETLWESVCMSRILHRFSSAATAVPDAKEQLWPLVESLLKEARMEMRERELVQVHARFHPEHVYRADSVTSLIDLDESVPSDPARDLAEFLTMMRMRKFRNAGSVSSLDGPTRVFLGEYLSLLPQNGANLRIHWGGRVLRGVLHVVSRSKDDPEALARVMEFGFEEFDRVMSGAFLPDGYAPV
jgi:hypothetical protein